MRPQDLACVGVFTGEDPRMLEKDVRLFEAHCGVGEEAVVSGNERSIEGMSRNSL
jgi:hypothetical protein